MTKWMAIRGPLGAILTYGLPLAALSFCIAGSAYQGMQVDGTNHYGTKGVNNDTNLIVVFLNGI